MANSRTTTALQEIRSRGEESWEGVRSGQWNRAATAVVAAALMSLGLKRRSFGGTLVAVAGGALLYRGLHGRTARRATTGGEARRGQFVEVERTLTVGRPAGELYRLWRDPSTLRRLLAGFADVTPTEGDGRHWEIREPLGRILKFDSRVVEDSPGEFMRWESTDDSPVRTHGWIHFRPAAVDRSTEVTLHVAFLPPGGALVEALAQRLRAIPTQRVLAALRRFKSLAETGEIPSLAHSTSTRVSADSPARR